MDGRMDCDGWTKMAKHEKLSPVVITQGINGGNSYTLK